MRSQASAHTATHAGESVLVLASRVLGNVVAAWRDAAAKRRAREELSMMAEHELADLGIARCDIDHVVETGQRSRVL